MRRVTDMVQDVVDGLARVAERPLYVKVADPSPRPEGDIPRIGIRPSYGGRLLRRVTKSLQTSHVCV